MGHTVSNRPVRALVLTCPALWRDSRVPVPRSAAEEMNVHLLQSPGGFYGKILTCCDLSHCLLFNQFSITALEARKEKHNRQFPQLSHVVKTRTGIKGRRDHMELWAFNICCETSARTPVELAHVKMPLKWRSAFILMWRFLKLRMWTPKQFKWGNIYF